MPTEIIAAFVAVGGVMLGGILQWFVSRSVVRSETERLRRQLSIEFNFQQFSTWQANFQETIAHLLAATDPEIAKPYKRETIFPLVLKAQLMLNQNIPAHARANHYINDLAMRVCGWSESQDDHAVLCSHAGLLEAAKNALYIPTTASKVFKD